MGNTVLIVDDSRVSRMMLSSFLKSITTDLTIIEAGNGQEAIEKAIEFKPSLVIMDINMPVMDGLSAVATLRPSMPSTTFVILTANVQSSSREKAQKLGIHLLAKPITEAVAKEAFALWSHEHE